MNKEKIIKFMKENKKPIYIVSGILIAAIVIYNLKTSFSQVNTDYLNDQTVSSLTFENAEMEYKDGVSTFTVEVYNDSGNIYELKDISINFKDSKDITTTLTGYVGEQIEIDGSKFIYASIDKDLTDSVSLEYVVNKKPLPETPNIENNKEAK